MSINNKIIFFILELIFGIGIGFLGTYLTTPQKPLFDLNLSIMIVFLTFYLFTLIGIGIPGFFHNRLINKNNGFLIGIKKAALGMLLGIIFVFIINSIDFLPYRVSSFYLPFSIPPLFGVLGFSHGIKIYSKYNIN